MTKDEISVVLIDDHPMVINGLKACLAYYDDIDIVATATDGDQALLLCMEHKPDVILMDISMPNMNGFAATEIIMEQFADSKILIFSMHDNREFVSDVIEAGAKGFMLKDTKAEEIHYAIKAVYEGRTYFSSTITSGLLNGPVKGAKRLTSREQTILSHIADGLSNKNIARTLGISIRTVEAHRRNIKAKLKLESVADLVRYAIDNSLTQR